MDKHCMIISGGDFSPIPQPDPDTFVIACDRGYAYAERCGIQPDLLVSDFDSYAGTIDPTVPVHRFRAEKDDTDTMIAIRTAIEQGFTSAELYCALGGRLDHTLANLQSLVFAEKHGLSMHIHSSDTEVLSLQNGSLRLPRRAGYSLSVFAMEDPCRGVSIHGAKYELDKVELSSAFPLGVSNEWADDEVVITVEDGILLVILSRLS